MLTSAILVLTMQVQTVWTGVYTDAQAMRGKAQFETIAVDAIERGRLAETVSCSPGAGPI